MIDQEALWQSMRAFGPETILCVAIVFMLVVRLFKFFSWVHMSYVALAMVAVAFWFAVDQWRHLANDPRGPDLNSMEMFSGLLIYDNFTIFLRLFLLGFTGLIIVLSLQTGIPDKEDSADFNVLLLGATLGMCIMASANHLMMVFIGIEMASLPSYALAGFLKGRRQSSEAALKYVVYGGGAAGVMLYGISLISGKFGTGYLPDVATGIAQGKLDILLLLGGLFLLIGIAFKLAAVPFHFWCPDVFEGAPAEVAGYLSVASKGAALALLARIVVMLAGPPDGPSFFEVARCLMPALAFFAAITATFGNLAAYGQTNLKRLLAYSTIAHAGYMLMGLTTLTKDGAGAVLFYLVAYLFMNLGAFAIVAYLRNLTGSEDLQDFRGMIYRAPVLVITLAVFILSLLGIPPLVGFMAKFQIFQVMFESAQWLGTKGQLRLSQIMYGLLVIGGLNTVVSAMYYIKVLKVMILERRLEEVEGRPVQPLRVPFLVKSFAWSLALVIVALGIFWNQLNQAAGTTGVSGFASHAQPAATAKGTTP
jgi:NADH-quinone oxidoreductase subunit N